MEKRVILTLLVMGVFVLSNRVDGKDQNNQINLNEIDRKLQLLNKPAVKSINSEDGDIIDCVDIYKQPALDHPALKNHTIQLKPSFEMPKETRDTTKNESSSSSASAKQAIIQTWQKSGSCPSGTIPIRRIRREDLLRASSLEQFGKKPPLVSHPSNESTDAKRSTFSSLNSSHAALQDPLPDRSIAQLFTYGYSYIGAKADLNVWNPSVEDGDYTTSQIWLKAGNGDSFESVEAGWAVNPQLYGDRQTRFFGYWTKDAYKSTGCFDLTCSGFVHTSPTMSFGAVISPLSVRDGQQYQISLSIDLDPNSGNWWLSADNVVVGYWPGTLFSSIRMKAIYVAWGGEVYSPNVKKTPHTKTAMGSGSFSRTLFGSAAFIKHPRIIDYSLVVKYPQMVSTTADEFYCYDAYNYREGVVGEPVFYFGGPGQNPPYCR